MIPITLAFISIQGETTMQKIEEKTIKTIPFSLDINNIKHEKGGQIIVFVFLEEGFPKKHEKSFLKFTYAISGKKLAMDINVPKKRDFAIKVLHDENMDERVTKNWTGIYPKDGLAFSNDAKIGFGPPSFKESKINTKDGMNAVLSIVYY